MKIDLKRELPSYRATRGSFDLITLPPLRYLMIDGQGDPNTSDTYADALASLYPVAYALKFLSKNDLGRDYTVMPLEGLWWADDPTVFTTRRDKSQWMWTLLTLIPDWLGDDHVDAARARAEAKAGPGAGRVRSEVLDEGLSMQTLHIGSYDDETAVLQRLHDEEIPARGLVMTGTHHEIYLSDARRTAPEKLRTILRQPVRPA
ncbi:MAG: hypothetical protein EOO67_05735 [Microbacterium sp.]|nr:MAG: hypothetical protein EOO67_05735 [Microbacterium sp.]